MFKSIHILYPVFYVFCWRVGNPEIFRESKMRSHHSLCQATVNIKKKYLFCFDKYCFFLHIFVVSFFFLLFFRMTNIMSSILFSVFLYYYCVFLVCLLLELSFICSIISNGVPETLSYPQDIGILKGMTSFLIILLFVW